MRQPLAAEQPDALARVESARAGRTERLGSGRHLEQEAAARDHIVGREAQLDALALGKELLEVPVLAAQLLRLVVALNAQLVL